MIDWSHWHNEPYLVGGLILLGWAYAVATGPLRAVLAPGVGVERGKRVLFYSSLVIFYLAVGSPLDQAGERYLLSAHMIQHQLLIYLAAPFFILGLPTWLAERCVGLLPGRTLRRALFHPVACGIIYTFTLSFWHVPALYDWALRDKLVHVIEHVMFFGAAVLYWWPIVSTAPSLPRLNAPVQLVYLGAVTIGMTPLFSFIAFSDNILYPTYEYAPRLFENFGAREDQLLGAGIMKLGGLFVMVIVSGISFYLWARKDRTFEGQAPA